MNVNKMTLAHFVVAAVLALSGTTAFGINQNRRMGFACNDVTAFIKTSSLATSTSAFTVTKSLVVLHVAANDDTTTDDAAAAAAETTDDADTTITADTVQEEPSSPDEASETVLASELVQDEEAPAPEPVAAVEEPVVPVEDPALTALKKEISDLESAIKAKARTVSMAEEEAERYTKAGYARRVAEVENARRMRKAMENSNAYSETATIMTSFLPIYDELIALRDLYQDDDFGKQYVGLTGAMKTAMKALGVEELTVEVGTMANKDKVLVIAEEHSKDFDKGVVMQTGKVGLELKGNILRLPEAVVSLGVAESGTGFGA